MTTLFPIPPRRRRGDPRLRLSRPSADDDRPHEAPRALRLAADDHARDVRGRRPALRRRHQPLASPATRAGMLELWDLGPADPRRAPDHPRPRRLHPGDPGGGSRRRRRRGPSAPAPIETDPAIVTELIERSQASIATLPRRDLDRRPDPTCSSSSWPTSRSSSGSSSSRGAIRSSWRAWRPAGWLNERLQQWLARRTWPTSSRSPSPTTSRRRWGSRCLSRGRDPPHPRWWPPARRRGRRTSWTSWPSAGGAEARAAIQAFLDAYGMRCIGEIDITRPRWSERPSTLVPVILGNVRNFEPGAGERRFEQGRHEGRAKEQDVLERLRVLPEWGSEGRGDQAQDRPRPDLHRLPRVSEAGRRLAHRRRHPERRHRPPKPISSGPRGEAASSRRREARWR